MYVRVWVTTIVNNRLDRFKIKFSHKLLGTKFELWSLVAKTLESYQNGGRFKYLKNETS